MRANSDILAERVKAFDARTGPRVGDYIYIPSDDDRIPEYTRITHDWGDLLQTGGGAGSSYYLGNSGYLSYSGGLDPGVKPEDLIPTDETRPGHVWFFDGNISGAGRGVDFNIPMRVFRVKDGADLDGIYSRHCPYYLDVLNQEQHGRTCGYWYTVTFHATSHTAFKTEAELRAWLRQNRLSLTRELTPAGTASSQRLAYSKGEV